MVGSTVKVASGSQATRSASWCSAMTPLRQPLLPGLGDQRQGVGRRQVHDVDAGIELPAKLDQQPDGVVLPRARPRGQVGAVIGSRAGARGGAKIQLSVYEQWYAGLGQDR